MKKPHKMTIKFENSEKTKVTRSFKTKEEADAFAEGANVANMADGINGFVYKYEDTSKK